jgi:hypothetical protein
MKLCVSIHWTNNQGWRTLRATRYEPAADPSMAGYLLINRLRTSHYLVKHHEISSTFRIHHPGNSPRGCYRVFADLEPQKMECWDIGVKTLANRFGEEVHESFS